MIKSALPYECAINQNWKTGLYIRLSKEDYSASDSVSVVHQRKILQQYAKDNNLTVIDEFVDDGYSGTTFERPAFHRMLESISRKEINCVITKDLSRLGRNHLEAGYYIETFFPENQIRYISINEQYDSLHGDSDLVPFMNIFNELYAKQTSKKNRQVFESKFHNGGMHSACISYGYLKNPDDKDKRIIDEEVKDIVNKIYDLAAEGKGPILIQQWLFDNKIECPSYRIYRKTGKLANQFANATDERKYKWNLSMIRRMLSDPVYLGHSVHYKKRTISYKNKRQKYYPTDQWMIVENTHPAIITQDKFDLVQSIICNRKRTTTSGAPALFAGLLKCSDCGCALAYYNREGKTMSRSYYVCGKHAQRNVCDTCTAHYIREDVLTSTVLSQIQALFDSVKIDKKAIIKKLIQLDKTDTMKQAQIAAEEIQTLERRKKVLLKLIPKVYEDWVEELITEENFKTLSSEYQKEQKEINDRIASLQNVISKSKSVSDPANKFVQLIDNLSYPTEVTRELLYSLIDKIVVYESEQNAKGKRNLSQRVDIYWKYIGFT
jgi:hypothetical protein